MKEEFVLGLDLDGVCADFYGRMRKIVAEWQGVDIERLTKDVSYGLREWGAPSREEYTRIHRFAVTERNLFKSLKPMAGASQSIRRLGTEGIRIRIITHRLFISYFHKLAVIQTAEWLDHHAIPYWDLCFMADKTLVKADIYIEDTEENIKDLQADKKKVITFTNSTNRNMSPTPFMRADGWAEAEALVRKNYHTWLKKHGRQVPPLPDRQLQGIGAPLADLPSPRAS